MIISIKTKDCLNCYRQSFFLTGSIHFILNPNHAWDFLLHELGLKVLTTSNRFFDIHQVSPSCP